MTEAVSVLLRLPDPELSKLMLEPLQSKRLRSRLLHLLSLMLDCSAGRLWVCSSSFKLEVDSLLEEKSERLDLALVLLMLRVRPPEVPASLSICVCDQVSERTSRDRVLWRNPGTLVSLLN